MKGRAGIEDKGWKGWELGGGGGGAEDNGSVRGEAMLGVVEWSLMDAGRGGGMLCTHTCHTTDLSDPRRRRSFSALFVYFNFAPFLRKPSSVALEPSQTKFRSLANSFQLKTQTHPHTCTILTPPPLRSPPPPHPPSSYPPSSSSPRSPLLPLSHPPPSAVPGYKT